MTYLCSDRIGVNLEIIMLQLTSSTKVVELKQGGHVFDPYDS